MTNTSGSHYQQHEKVSAPQAAINKLGLNWTYYDTSEKGWHIFHGADCLGPTIISKVLRRFSARDWYAEVDPTNNTKIRVTIR